MRWYRSQWHNEPTGRVPLRFSTFPANDGIAREPVPTKSWLFPTHCKKFFPDKPVLPWIDQLVAISNLAMENTLSTLEICDTAFLEDFYRSAFEVLGQNVCANILDLWMRAMSSEVLLGIQNTYSKDLTCHGLYFQVLSPFTWADYLRYARRSLSYIMRKPWREASFQTASRGSKFC